MRANTSVEADLPEAFLLTTIIHLLLKRPVSIPRELHLPRWNIKSRKQDSSSPDDWDARLLNNLQWSEQHATCKAPGFAFGDHAGFFVRVPFKGQFLRF